MSSRFVKKALCFLGIVLASLSARDTAAVEEDPIPLASAKWIAVGMPGATEGETPPIGMPGVHVHGSTHAPAGSSGDAAAANAPAARTQPGTNPPVAAAPPNRSDNRGESSRTIRPTLSELPFDTPIREQPPDFIRNHRFGVELKSRF